MGKNYELSLALIGDKLSRKLNKKYRKIDKPAAVLSFSFSKQEGEIFINLNLAQKQCFKFDRNFEKFTGFLLIHGLMHLKGCEHSSKMERAEERIRRRFEI